MFFLFPDVVNPSSFLKTSGSTSSGRAEGDLTHVSTRSTVAWTVLAVFGSLAVATAEQPKEPGGKRQITNSLGMTFIYCPSGSFTMGSPAAERARFDNEAQVSVTISKGFYLGKTSVTQAEFKAVMGTTPWSGKEYVKEGDDYPATYIDWNDAAEFCRKLTARESQAGRLPQGYVCALPTEAQREYACRAGTTTAYSFGNDRSALGDYAWWGGMKGEGSCKMEQYCASGRSEETEPVGLLRSARQRVASGAAIITRRNSPAGRTRSWQRARSA